MLHRRLPRIDLPNHTYFLGCCINWRRKLFLNDNLAQYLLDLYIGLRDRGDIRLHGYVIMPDHYHVLIGLLNDSLISKLMQEVHSLAAKECLRVTRAKKPIWQRRSYDHVIRNHRDWLTRLKYIHNNPVTEGLVENAIDYPWSSCRFRETGEGPVKCDGWE